MFLRLSTIDLHSLIKFLNFFNFKPILNLITEDHSLKNIRFSKQKIVFLFLLKLLKKVSSTISSTYIKGKAPVRLVLSRFIYVLAWIFANKTLFKHLEFFLLYISRSFIPHSQVTFKFFSINRFSINSKFLSRYIAKKLKQNYSIWELINPIKKELLQVSNETTLGAKVFFNTHSISYKQGELLFKQSLFKKEISFLNIQSKKFLYNFSRVTYSLMSLTNLLTYSQLLSTFLINKLVNKLFYCYTKNQHILNFMFYNDFSSYLNKISYFSDLKTRSIEYFSFFNLLWSKFWLSFGSFFTNLKSDYLTNKTFVFGNLLTNKFFLYRYWKFNYNFVLKINKKKQRSFLNIMRGQLIGFKFHCKGRFSRKQRASSVWFRQIKIPLNTLNANIDYSFYSIPVKNSSVGIKIWLYRKENFTKFYFKLN